MTADAETRTAVHEAGHAIAAIETSCDLHNLRLKGAAGETKWTYYDPKDAALVTAAGIAAERHMLKGGRRVEGSDRKRLHALWQELGRPGDFDGWARRLVVKAVRLLNGRQKCMKRLAKTLQRRGQMSKGEVIRTIAPTTPETGEGFTQEEKARLTEADRRRADAKARQSVKGRGGVQEWVKEQERRAEEYGRQLKRKCESEKHEAACAVL